MLKKRIVLLILPALILGMCCHVLADEQLDLNKKASVTFVMEFDGVPLDGGGLTLYQVGQMDTDGKGFSLVEPLLQDGPSLEDLQAAGFGKTLYELAAACGLQSVIAAVSNGQAVAAELNTGLYVVGQNPGDETPGYAPIDPFLIALPQWQNGSYVYDLTAAPKVPLVPAPTDPTDPTQPTEPENPPDIPQTGQLNWPIPLMAVLGLAVFVLGWGLYFGEKRRRP